ncbi:MAG: DUF3737 family protein [Treponema sp.]|nr:DUF3737 family protein [Treponema sp.]
MTYENQTYDEERALYGIQDATVKNCRFTGPADGESFLKECQRIDVSDCFMNLRYPLWHVTDGKLTNCEMTENCRAALWYDENIEIDNCRMFGIKALRECSQVVLKNTVVNSPEFIWKVNNLLIDNVEIIDSEYPFFEVLDAKINGLKLKGKYSFQYDENIEITNSVLDTKDAFWHGKNMVIRDSVIKGEYLAWYSENLTFINCKIIGTQPFCYCKNLVLENCTLENCDLSFERSSVKATIVGKIDSVKNPLKGIIVADEIGEIILDESVGGKTDCLIKVRES